MLLFAAQLCAPATFLAASRHLLAMSKLPSVLDGELVPTLGEIEGFVSSAVLVMQQLLASAEGEVAMEAAQALVALARYGVVRRVDEFRRAAGLWIGTHSLVDWWVGSQCRLNMKHQHLLTGLVPTPTCTTFTVFVYHTHVRLLSVKHGTTC